MNAADIREMTEDELNKEIGDHRQEALNLRLQAQSGQLENTARIREVRRELARLYTVQTERAKKTQQQ